MSLHQISGTKTTKMVKTIGRSYEQKLMSVKYNKKETVNLAYLTHRNIPASVLDAKPATPGPHQGPGGT